VKNNRLLLALLLLFIFTLTEIKAQSYTTIQPSGSQNAVNTDAGSINIETRRSTLHFIYNAIELNDAGSNAVLAGPFTRAAGLTGSQSFDISGVGAQFIYVSASVYRTNTTPQIDDIWLTVTEPSPLPVELTSLSAECDNDKVEIAWTTASELYSSHYIVQRSDDLTSWTDVAIVNGKGTSNVTSNYMVTDYSPLRDVNYYRLIQYDMNGEFEEYGPISSKCNYSDFSISLYPNPNDGDFTIRSESDHIISDAVLSIVDATGKIIHSEKTTFGKGTTLYKFHDLNLLKGSYFLMISHTQKAIQPIKFIVR